MPRKYKAVIEKLTGPEPVTLEAQVTVHNPPKKLGACIWCPKPIDPCAAWVVYPAIGLTPEQFAHLTCDGKFRGAFDEQPANL